MRRTIASAGVTLVAMASLLSPTPAHAATGGLGTLTTTYKTIINTSPAQSIVICTSWEGSSNGRCLRSRVLAKDARGTGAAVWVSPHRVLKLGLSLIRHSGGTKGRWVRMTPVRIAETARVYKP